MTAAATLHPHQVTDWQKVAMFFAGMLKAEHPEWQGYILQVIKDNTDTPMGSQTPERNAA